MKLFCICILIYLAIAPSAAQPPDMQRSFYIPANRQVYQLDSLSIIQDSFTITGPDGNSLDNAFYETDYIRARLSLRIPEFWRDDSLYVTYRVWPVNFSTPIFSKDTSLIRLPGPGEDPISIPLRQSFPEQGLLRFEGLQSSGSITRGLTMGNRQDITLNSAMNLQLSGKLSEEIDILAVISDQNIPFQPEGTTQQIQDFDKVFIQLSGMGASLTAGDFELKKPPGYFINMERKARGLNITYESEAGDTTLIGNGQLRVSAAGAISRGKYARNVIPGMEGNQGPYRLTGNDNESFIMVLAGTERVYLDGILLTRGMEYDYVIDYNMAEVTFTPSRMITRDSRIVVEFEYAERNYARSMIFTGTEMLYEKARFRMNFFSEQDHPNQSLFQELSDERKATMASVGDSIHRAFDWNIDSTGFQNDRVMYRVTDTLGFDSVFVHSTDPHTAVYQLGFTYVGQGNGNYNQINSALNGRVFQWVAPRNGISHGTHEPVILLITPKSHQMLSLGGEVDVSTHTVFDFEYGLSNRDINLFSNLHKDNRLGHAIKLGLTDTRKTTYSESPDWMFITKAGYELTDKNFRPLERYRGVEFERDWNLEGIRIRETEHLSEFSFEAQQQELGMIGYRFKAFLMGEEYQGVMNSIDNQLSWGKNKIEYYGNLLHTDGVRVTNFYRHRAAYLREFNFLWAGVNHQMEKNRIRLHSSDTLSFASNSFEEWEFHISNPDTTVNQYRLFYKYRNDDVPEGERFKNATHAHDYGFRYQYLDNPNQRIGLQAIYRVLEVQQQRIPGEQNEQSVNGRLDYFSNWAEGAITSNLFFETASGMEQKREYIYVEVPPGQGAYIWNDYNDNGIMELDEFEIAPFPNEANFIRVAVPTREFLATYTTSLSQNLRIEPMAIWRQAEGWRKIFSRFSNRLNYRIDKKTLGNLGWEKFDPIFSDVADSALITLNTSFRNSLAFNRTHPVYNIEWTVLDNRNKNLLSNGFETRITKSQSVRTRWNFSRQYALHLLAAVAESINESEFFVQRNYHLEHQEIEPSVSYQPGSNLRISLAYGYHNKTNITGTIGEQSSSHKTGIEIRYSMPARGSIQARYEISQIDYPFAENTSIAFEILQGLRPGTNNLWNISWQQNLSNYLQLNLNYNGRKPPGVSSIHTGTIQLRALF